VRKARRTFALLAVALLACALVAILSREREPSYHGRKLSEWAAAYSHGPGNPPSATERQEAAEAIRQVGASAIPWLLAWTDYEPPHWKHALNTIVSEVPNRIFRSQPVERLFVPRSPATPLVERATAAREAFAALGPLAAPAIPELIRRINATNSPFRRCTAMLALSHLGPQAVPAMAALLSNPSQAADFCAAECIRNLGTNARPLLPLLMQNLQQTNWRAAAVSARALGDTNFAPDLVVPALTGCLQHPRREVRMEAPLALMEFGAQARSALPALSNAVADGSFDVRKNAIIAIQQIASEAFTNAPAH
jgi:hypothetical protein